MRKSRPYVFWSEPQGDRFFMQSRGQEEPRSPLGWGAWIASGAEAALARRNVFVREDRQRFSQAKNAQ